MPIETFQYDSHTHLVSVVAPDCLYGTGRSVVDPAPCRHLDRDKVIGTTHVTLQHCQVQGTVSACTIHPQQQVDKSTPTQLQLVSHDLPTLLVIGKGFVSTTSGYCKQETSFVGTVCKSNIKRASAHIKGCAINNNKLPLFVRG